MTIGEWIETVELARTQYQDGAITAQDYFCQVVNAMTEVPESEITQQLENYND